MLSNMLSGNLPAEFRNMFNTGLPGLGCDRALPLIARRKYRGLLLETSLVGVWVGALEQQYVERVEVPRC
jgi:hypothetical protein